jgi:hypothetical protein
MTIKRIGICEKNEKKQQERGQVTNDTENVVTITGREHDCRGYSEKRIHTTQQNDCMSQQTIQEHITHDITLQYPHAYAKCT